MATDELRERVEGSLLSTMEGGVPIMNLLLMSLSCVTPLLLFTFCLLVDWLIVFMMLAARNSLLIMWLFIRLGFDLLTCRFLDLSVFVFK